MTELRSCDAFVPEDPSRWDLHSALEQLHRTGPVQPVTLPGGLRAWLVTGAQAARTALSDPRLAHDLRRLPDPDSGFGGSRFPDDIFAVEGRHLLNSDGEDHRRLRTILAPGLTRARAEALIPLIEHTCADLLNHLSGDFDLIAGYARPLVVRTTAATLGVPERFVPQLAELTAAAISDRSPGQATFQQNQARLLRLWSSVLGHKRRDPGDDLLSLLVAARRTEQISAQEMVSVAWGLFSGGISPMITLLAAGTVELLRAGNPPGERVIDELLRLTSPFPVSQWRFALADIPLAGAVIPQGAVVLIALAAANRDPSCFAGPGALQPHRGNAAAHFAFGARPHYCPGAHLARLQARIALGALFSRFPNLRLAVPERDLRWHGLLVERCYDSLPVTA
ncbi:cytochrome P450 [Kineosporia babensis]|uniref:Cytochrome P450 n=1 Tax=Kineosporia babensis TaxID=499548 RepID=A0A9X1NMW8_9ACTN|nr:cytochrome P450 [Kineosporia babensis]MCD5316023.1 cytochrome P450 [Kineosporia babensis]